MLEANVDINHILCYSTGARRDILIYIYSIITVSPKLKRSKVLSREVYFSIYPTVKPFFQKLYMRRGMLLDIPNITKVAPELQIGDWATPSSQSHTKAKAKQCPRR